MFSVVMGCGDFSFSSLCSLALAGSFAENPTRDFVQQHYFQPATGKECLRRTERCPCEAAATKVGHVSRAGGKVSTDNIVIIIVSIIIIITISITAVERSGASQLLGASESCHKTWFKQRLIEQLDEL
uniref:Uncharacterized protein n=1 Tax=Anopheles atroparvus TaxID=41427 RepID=A0A182IN96_ANOAO